MSKHIPDVRQRAQIRSVCLASEATIRAAYADPSRVKPASLDRITRAALELGIAPPQLASQPGANG